MLRQLLLRARNPSRPGFGGTAASRANAAESSLFAKGIQLSENVISKKHLKIGAGLVLLVPCAYGGYSWFKAMRQDKKIQGLASRQPADLEKLGLPLAIPIPPPPESYSHTMLTGERFTGKSTKLKQVKEEKFASDEIHLVTLQGNSDFNVVEAFLSTFGLDRKDIHPGKFQTLLGAEPKSDLEAVLDLVQEKLISCETKPVVIIDNMDKVYMTNQATYNTLFRRLKYWESLQICSSLMVASHYSGKLYGKDWMCPTSLDARHIPLSSISDQDMVDFIMTRKNLSESERSLVHSQVKDIIGGNYVLAQKDSKALDQILQDARSTVKKIATTPDHRRLLRWVRDYEDTWDIVTAFNGNPATQELIESEILAMDLGPFKRLHFANRAMRTAVQEHLQNDEEEETEILDYRCSK